MSSRSRLAVRSALGVALLVLVGACGSSDENPTAPTITIKPQSYQAKPAADDETTPASTTPVTADQEGFTDQVQRYTVEEGDYPSTVASMFEVDLNDLIEFNGWTLSNGIVPEFPRAGEEIMIPPPSKVLEDTTDTTTAGTTADGADIVDASTPTSGSGADAADADRCTAGTYTVQEGDYPGKVAQRLDVDVDALNAANAATEGYNIFYVGLEIVVPPASDC